MRILLWSGGMDSFIAYYMLKEKFGDEIKTAYVSLGHRYQDKEMRIIRELDVAKIIPLHGIIRNLQLGAWESPDAHIPMRNMFMIQLAAMTAPEAVEVYLVAQKGEQSIPDRSPKFFTNMSAILTEQLDKRVLVLNPCQDMTKVQMVKWFKERYPEDIEHLRKTVGCYSPSDKHCGACGSCLRRSVAFEANGIELDEQLHDIKKWSDIQKYIDNMKSGKYDKERTLETLMIFKKWGWEV